MINFNAGAWRPAAGQTRATQLAAANDLVTRTLAQHGLTAGPMAGLPAGGGSDALPTALSGLMARLQPNAPPASAPEDLPNGALFAEGTFTCAAGTRRYRTYVPASAAEGVTGLVVMLHGCTQTPEDFAKGTGMNALAERHRFIVVYPHQSRGDNAQSCWNWFSRGDQQRDRGEPAIIAGLTREAIADHAIPKGKVFVAGLSAGAAMAVILGDTYPDLFKSVGAHSGLPAGAAQDVPSAFAAMAGRVIESAPGKAATRTIVFHGDADATVHPSNGERIVRQALDGGPRQSLQTEDEGTSGGRTYRRCTTYDEAGTEAVEHWVVEGLGHAWSGGQTTGSYTDPQGPDASTEMVRFFFSAST
ncbi:alpha/beta hydrolase family esterase [Chachezhania antarctica]|uniref:extracellular catalytic domain type 1 short-chain-length polyhydroxyalkanoate depolymerase n=1 Tax=Chachezhania antarctica TaxID=2340860 RepID=UPI000EAC205F|nr:PHB depolymerase family esterase [Chachezhania antarctica]|tara:strand:+ start:1335 stop:2414 length:1080 start_codon:yes stop_codon:yes gene_type:complete